MILIAALHVVIPLPTQASSQTLFIIKMFKKPKLFFTLGDGLVFLFFIYCSSQLVNLNRSTNVNPNKNIFSVKANNSIEFTLGNFCDVIRTLGIDCKIQRKLHSEDLFHNL